MKLHIFNNFESLSVHAADVISRQVCENPGAVLCLATGNTPMRTYEHLVALARKRKIDYSRVQFVELDEWIGIQPSQQGSCHFFLNQYLFSPLRIDGGNIHLFDALSGDSAGQCSKMDDIIKHLGGVDLMLVGIGMNGHVGFNEPGVPPNLYSHVADLDETTRLIGQKYFEQETLLAQGITLGLRHFLEARTAIVLANGSAKAAIIRQALQDPISPKIPAGFIRQHPNGYVFLDEPAASLLTLNANEN
jgi:glucosamine-6-phosphate isomerase